MTKQTNDQFNSSLKERLAQVAEYLKQGKLTSTMHSRTELHEPSPGGRFSAVVKRTVVGSGEVPSYPAGSGWTQDPVPPEPPTGIDINAQEPCGEAFEIAASIKQKEQGNADK